MVTLDSIVKWCSSGLSGTGFNIGEFEAMLGNQLSQLEDAALDRAIEAVEGLIEELQTEYHEGVSLSDCSGALSQAIAAINDERGKK